MRPSRPLARALLAFALLAAAAPTLAGEDPSAHLSVVSPWARETPGASTVSAAYLKVESRDGWSDRLVGASSPVAGRVELHTHLVKDGMMMMREIDGVDIGPDRPGVFAPGGNHIMLMDLKRPLKAGEQIPLTLRFDKAGTIEVQAEVKGLAAMSGGEHAHHHHHHME